jgi:hypothetical protein
MQLNNHLDGVVYSKFEVDQTGHSSNFAANIILLDLSWCGTVIFFEFKRLACDGEGIIQERWRDLTPNPTDAIICV